MTGRRLIDPSCARRHGAGRRACCGWSAILATLLLVGLAELGARRRRRLGGDRGRGEEGRQAQPLPQPAAAGRRGPDRGLRGSLSRHQGGDGPARQRRHDAALRGRDDGRRLPGRRADDQLRRDRGRLDRQGLGARVDAARSRRLSARVRHRDHLFTTQLYREAIIYNTTDQAGRRAQGLRRPLRSQVEGQGRPQSALALGDGAGRGRVLGEEARHHRRRAEA